MAARKRRPRRQRPCLRARLVEAPVSSMKTSFVGSRSSCPANHSRRRFCTSARCCSSACAVFSKALFTLVSETGILGCRPGDLAMDDGSFASWLGAIRLLTDVQRRTGFMCLALAEADDDVAVVSAEVEQRLPPSVEEISGAIDGEHVGIVSTATGDARPAPASALAAALSRVERAGCPHCASQRLQRWGRASDLPRYRCRDCRRTFNGLTGTPLAHLRKKDRWGAQAEALITGESVVKAAKRCGVSGTTAFRWRHRFLAATALDKPARLSGIVEADETFILESFKGKRSDLPRPARKRGGKAAKRGLSAEQIPVLVARDRSGATTDAVLAKLNRASVTAALAGIVTS